MKKIFLPLFDYFEVLFKFANVIAKGDTAMQVGVDMDSTSTADIFLMAQAAGANGRIIGIEPDPSQLEKARSKSSTYKTELLFIEKATFSSKGIVKMHIGKNRGNNTIDPRSLAEEESYTGEVVDVEMDTIDNIIQELGISPKEISHVFISNNGAEFETLKGMTSLMRSNDNLSINLFAGRIGDEGLIDGRPDQEVISEYLKEYGYKSKFIRLNQFFWNGWIKMYLLRGILRGHFKKFHRVFPGIVMARKGNKTFGFWETL